MRRTVFLECVEGDCSYGRDEVLLEADIDLSKNLGTGGYSVAPIFDKSTAENIKETVTAFVASAVEIALEGLTAEEFTLEKYHKFVSTDLDHERVFQHIRKGLPSETLSVAVGTIKERISEICEMPVRLYLNTINVRICRPGKPDNNPFHRDVYLDRLRNKLNVYVPIAGSDDNSSLPLIPGSHRWPENKIKKTNNHCSMNGRTFTVPAIVEVAFEDVDALRPNPHNGEVLLFSPYLIHGGGSNLNTDTTRVSLEMRFEPVHKPEVSNMPKLVKLGVGSVWFGLPWPPNNDRWSQPDVFEVVSYLSEVIASARESGEAVLLDTAPAYRDAERLIGQALGKLDKSVSRRIVVSTKFGEYYDPSAGKNTTDFSLKRTHLSLENSHSLLGDLNIIYMHITSQLCEGKSLEILNNSDLYTEIQDIREHNKYGVQLIGVTLSNVNLLKEVIDKNLLREFDVLQIPGWIVRQEPALVMQWKKRRNNNMVVVNSPVRHKPVDMTPQIAYRSVMLDGFVDVVLTGTRSHWQETAKVFEIREI